MVKRHVYFNGKWHAEELPDPPRYSIGWRDVLIGLAVMAWPVLAIWIYYVITGEYLRF